MLVNMAGQARSKGLALHHRIGISTGSVSPFNLGNDTAKFDISLSIVETHGSLCGVIEYSTELFEQATVTTMKDAYIEGLRRIIENPGQQISELAKPAS